MATIQVRGKGNVTIPARLRQKYGIGDGDLLTVIEIGNGCLLLWPKLSQIDILGGKITQLMNEENVSSEEMVEALDAERETFYREHYAKP